MMKFPDPASESEDTESLSIHNPCGFGLPLKRKTFEKILIEIEAFEDVSFRKIELVYVEEYEIVEINQTYLNQGYVTDIISFRYDESDNQAIEGTLYCCAPRIAEQSAEYSTSLKDEFSRIFIHGLLHLIGYDHQTNDEKRNMRNLEDQYLSRIFGL